MRRSQSEHSTIHGSLFGLRLAPCSASRVLVNRHPSQEDEQKEEDRASGGRSRFVEPPVECVHASPMLPELYCVRGQYRSLAARLQ